VDNPAFFAENPVVVNNPVWISAVFYAHWWRVELAS